MWMLNAAELAGVAQLGQSVRLIIERSRARVPPPASPERISKMPLSPRTEHNTLDSQVKHFNR